MKLYLSSKITGCADYKTRFEQAGYALKRKGYEILDPTDYVPVKMSWELQIAYCFELIADPEVKGICLFGDWENSYGARIEKLYAEKLNKPVKTVIGWLTV